MGFLCGVLLPSLKTTWYLFILLNLSRPLELGQSLMKKSRVYSEFLNTMSINKSVKLHISHLKLGLAGITLSPTKFSSLDWTDFKDEYGLIAGGKFLNLRK